MRRAFGGVGPGVFQIVDFIGRAQLALDHQLPIANAILTTDNEDQAIARQTDKGRDAARVAVEMALLMKSLS